MNQQESYLRMIPEARRISTRMTQEIIAIANQGPEEESHAYAGLIASLVLQTMVTLFAVQLHEPGSADGEAWLSTMYHEALKDALMRWHRPDLKQHFSKSNPKH